MTRQLIKYKDIFCYSGKRPIWSIPRLTVTSQPVNEIKSSSPHASELSR